MTTVLRGEKPARKGQLQATREGMTYSVDREYYVLSDVKNESELNVLATTGLPIIGISSLAGFPGAICRSLSPQQNEKQPQLWTVTANFSTQPINQEAPPSGPNPGDPPNPDPTTWIPVYRGQMQYYPEVVWEDFSNPPKKWINHAKSPFSEPLTVTRPVIVYDFWQYEADTVTDKQIGDRNDCINSSGVTRGGVTYPQYTLKVSIPEFERGYYFGYQAVRIHYQVAYKPSTWKVKPLQVGYEYFVAPGDKETVAAPQLIHLNSDGTKRDKDLGILSDVEFVPHKDISFSFLR